MSGNRGQEGQKVARREVTQAAFWCWDPFGHVYYFPDSLKSQEMTNRNTDRNSIFSLMRDGSSGSSAQTQDSCSRCTTHMGQGAEEHQPKSHGNIPVLLQSYRTGFVNPVLHAPSKLPLRQSTFIGTESEASSRGSHRFTGYRILVLLSVSTSPAPQTSLAQIRSVCQVCSASGLAEELPGVSSLSVTYTLLCVGLRRRGAAQWDLWLGPSRYALWQWGGGVALENGHLTATPGGHRDMIHQDEARERRCSRQVRQRWQSLAVSHPHAGAIWGRGHP